MKDNIKVELYNDGDYVGIRTYERNHGARGRFLIARRVMIDAMFEPEQKTTVDMDCGNFAEIWRTDKDLWVRITWLSESTTRQVWGFRQTLKIPYDRLKQILQHIGKIKYLYQPRREGAKIVASESAGRTIQHIMEDKHTRRAFIKAMRDCFQWPNEVVTLYNDGGYSFYFVTKSGFPKNGGLILHDGMLRDGHAYLRYSVHT